MFSWKQILGAILFIGCLAVFVIASRTKKKYLNEIKKMAEENSTGE